MTPVHTPARGDRRFGRVAWVRDYRRDPLAFISALATGHDLSRVRPGRRDIYVLNSPELIRQVVASDQRVVVKGATIRASKRLLGNGLLSSEGEMHAQQRKLLQPAFHRRELGRFAQAAVDVADRHLRGWEDGAPVNFHLEVRRVVIAILGRSLFSGELGQSGDDVVECVATLQEVARNVGIPGAGLYQRLPLPAARRLTAAEHRLDEVVASVLERRRHESGEGEEPPRDFLSILLDPGLPGGEAQPRDQAMTMMVAGHETTAGLLGWCGWLLATHPDEQARVQAEVGAVLDGRLPAEEDLDRLPQMHAFLSEALRLYPPIWAFSRITTGPFSLDGVAIPPGSVLLTSPYVTQRDERFFEDPHAFRPDRWLGEWRPGRFEYFPFGGGPRMCIGEGFAWTVAKVVLAMIASGWMVRAAGPAPVPEALVTLRPGGGVPVTLHRRGEA